MKRISIPIKGTNKFASATVDENVSEETLAALSELAYKAYHMKLKPNLNRSKIEQKKNET